MCGDWSSTDVRSSHGILVRACNFHCEFCNYSFHDESKYRAFTDDEFAEAIVSLLPYGNRFKFSGGEPTLDGSLSDKVSFVKQLGGFVFLDTNGSRPSVVEALLSRGLIDVLGVSLKGVTPEQALVTSAICNRELCWDNPLRTISLSRLFPQVRFIVTHVFCESSSIGELEQFANLLPQIDNVYLKINNLLFETHNRRDMKAMDKERFDEMISVFLGNNPHWRSRTILVDTTDAIVDYSAIKFL